MAGFELQKMATFHFAGDVCEPLVFFFVSFAEARSLIPEISSDILSGLEAGGRADGLLKVGGCGQTVLALRKEDGVVLPFCWLEMSVQPEGGFC